MITLRFLLMILAHMAWQCAGAQGFINTYGGALAQDGVAIVPTPTGYAVGVRTNTDQEPTHVAQLLTIGSNGTGSAWETIGDVQGNSFPQAMAVGPGQAIFLVGSVIAPDSSSHDAFLLKRSLDGAQQWIAQPHHHGDEQYFALKVLPDGSSVAAGVRAIGADHDIWVTHFAADGTVQWNAAFGSALDEEAYDLVVSGNDIMLTGRQVNFGGTTDAFFARLDLTDGTVLWTTSWGGGANETGRAIRILGAGTFVMAGSTNSFGMWDTNEQRIKESMFLIGIDLNGDTLWTRTVGDTLYDRRAFCIDFADNTDLLIGGERSELHGESDADVYRFNASTGVVWERAWDLGKEERLLSMLALQDGFITAGWSFDPLARQVLIVRRDPNGN